MRRPLASLSLRFLISGLIAVLIARALGQTWRLAPQQARAVILFGLCQNALYLGLNFIAMQSVEASLAAIIAAVDAPDRGRPGLGGLSRTGRTAGHSGPGRWGSPAWA